MRRILGLIAVGLVAGCSSSTDPSKNPNPMMMAPVEPPPKAVYQPVDYPAAPYGMMMGNTVENLTFPAILPGGPKDTLGTISLADYFDPDGARGINAIVIITSAEWCGACMQEAQTLESKIRSEWGAKGVVVVELMLEDTKKGRTQELVAAAADRWRTKFNFANIPVGIDPDFTMARGASGSIGLPLNHVINPRDMTVKLRQMGAGGKVDSEISALVNANKLQ